MSQKNGSVFFNFIWRFAERSGAQIVTFIVSIILARILSPDDYGTVAILTVIITILQVFVDSGLGNALIQKKDADDIDFSTVFFLNVIFCIIIYLILWFCAPFISHFYHDTQLISLTRVLGITILISGVKNIQQAYVARNMIFKKFFYATLGGTVFSAFVGIIIAYMGGGSWAIVAQNLSNTVIDTIILWIIVPWRPKRVFDVNRLKKLWSFGWKLLCSALLDTVYNNIRALIIGKKYSSSQLAFYNQGQKFPYLIVSNINTSIDSVLLPTMAQAQEKTIRIRELMRTAISVSMYIMTPLMIGLFTVSDTLVEVLLTNKWIECVPYLKVFCLIFLIYPLHTANLNALKAMGRSDLFLRLEIIKKIIGFLFLIITINGGVYVILLGLLISDYICLWVNTVPLRRILQYGLIKQIVDIIPVIISSIIMGGLIIPIRMIHTTPLIVLFLQVAFGVLVYFIQSKVLRLKGYVYIVSVLKEFMKKSSV